MQFWGENFFQARLLIKIVKYHILWIKYHSLYPFVSVKCFVPIENFSLIWTSDDYRWRAWNFDLCSSLMAIEQSGFFRVPHLLWNEVSVYNFVITLIAERFAVELSTCHYLFDNLGRSFDSNTQPYACRANSLTHCDTAATLIVKSLK